MLRYICLYRKYHTRETREEVWCEVPMVEGYAAITGMMTLDGWLAFSGVEISDGGYIGQEIVKLLKQINKP